MNSNNHQKKRYKIGEMISLTEAANYMADWPTPLSEYHKNKTKTGYPKWDLAPELARDVGERNRVVDAWRKWFKCHLKKESSKDNKFDAGVIVDLAKKRYQNKYYRSDCTVEGVFGLPRKSLTELSSLSFPAPRLTHFNIKKPTTIEGCHAEIEKISRNLFDAEEKIKELELLREDANKYRAICKKNKGKRNTKKPALED